MNLTLHHAILAGDTARLSSELALGADLTVLDHQGNPALVLAAEDGTGLMIQLLVAAGADTNAPRTTDGKTALMSASERGFINEVRVLLECDADVNASDFQGRTALMFAAIGRNTDVIEVLLDFMADLMAQDHEGLSTLAHSINAGHTDLSPLILRKLSDRGLSLQSDEKALLLAIANNAVELIDKMMELGARAAESIHIKGKGGDLVDRTTTTIRGTIPSPKRASAKSVANSRNSAGQTALIVAASKGEFESVKKLLRLGADVNAKDFKGFTPLMMAAANGHTETVEHLLLSRIDVNLKSVEGWTALAFAAIQGHSGAVELLIAQGANIEFRRKGSTLLMMVASRGHTQIVEQLLSVGADPATQDYEGETAGTYARKAGHLELARQLDIQSGSFDGYK